MEFQTSNGVILSLPKSDINEEIVFGDLVQINPEDNKYTKSNKEYNPYVIGICIDKPSKPAITYYLNGINIVDENKSKEINVLVSGIAQVKVSNHVNIGDLLVSSNEIGKAMAARYNNDHYNDGKIIGKVLQYTSNEDEVIALISMS